MAIPPQLLSEVKEKHNCTVFFETGLYHGYSARIALDMGFEKVMSIELLQRFVDRGKDTFKKEIAENRYFVIPDDSANLGNHLSSILDDRVVFWLDAHIDNPLNGAVCQPLESCPVVREINSLSVMRQKPVILVDDISIIEGSAPWGDRSPDAINLEKIISAINNLPFDYSISYWPSVSSEKDILVAV